MIARITLFVARLASPTGEPREGVGSQPPCWAGSEVVGRMRSWSCATRAMSDWPAQRRAKRTRLGRLPWQAMTTPHAAARELEWVGSEYMLSWLGRTPETTITPFGAARALRTPDHADVDFLNTVHRLLPEDAAQVPHIAQHYAEVGIRPWLELMPAPDFEELAAALVEAGGRQIGFLAMLERELPAPPAGALPA